MDFDKITTGTDTNDNNLNSGDKDTQGTINFEEQRLTMKSIRNLEIFDNLVDSLNGFNDEIKGKSSQEIADIVSNGADKFLNSVSGIFEGLSPENAKIIEDSIREMFDDIKSKSEDGELTLDEVTIIIQLHIGRLKRITNISSEVTPNRTLEELPEGFSEELKSFNDEIKGKTTQEIIDYVDDLIYKYLNSIKAGLEGLSYEDSEIINSFIIKIGIDLRTRSKDGELTLNDAKSIIQGYFSGVKEIVDKSYDENNRSRFIRVLENLPKPLKNFNTKIQ